MEATIIKLIVGWFYGTTMENLSHGFHEIMDFKGWKNKLMSKGECPVIMKPIYAIGFGLVFPELIDIFAGFPAWIRFIFYANITILIEYYLGYFFDKVFKRIPWDYTMYQDQIGNGYTRASLWAMWGFNGLILESLHLYLRGVI